MNVLANVKNIVYMGALIVLAVMLMLCLLRAVLGPRVADRIVAVNMMGTIVMVMIAILAVKMEEGYLVDICLIYAMVSFLSVIVITKVYMGVYRERKRIRRKEKDVCMDTVYCRNCFPFDRNRDICHRALWQFSL